MRDWRISLRGFALRRRRGLISGFHASHMKHEWSDAERHLIFGREQRNRFGLDEAQLIGPGIKLDSGTKRECGDLIDLVFVQIRSAFHQLAQPAS